MRNSLPKVATLAALAGALLIPAVPASAAAAPVAAKAAAADPYSAFDVKVKASKTAKAGGKIKYTIVATNKGPHYADAWFVGGEFPKGVDMKSIRYDTNHSKMRCELVSARAFWCPPTEVIEVGDSVTLAFYAKLKKSAKGTQKATIGIVSYNFDQGMENLNKEELDRLGVPRFGFEKSVKTKVVR
ncbi:DUF11 domain-containing protein [Nonomuraea sp. SYSU D8015]|uniref:DUF11 domain-containing protein n=1 Tax=Nonomuraea sp. SYSU D8015 TaxID=2593644 RepID=UPI0016613D3A|nr:DUF11 domain-containing protein [Nonomuraea sp. SYSU D8015]